jgi:3-hydroxybutyryl-CoA dehydrogenase
MIKKVLVVGAGTMGQGIAQWFCQQGIDVQLTDINKDVLDNGISKVKDSWKKLCEKGKLSAKDVLVFSNHLSAGLESEIDPNVSLVIEAIIEDLKIKKETFLRLDKLINPEAIFASNTSSISINSLCEELKVHRKRNFLGLHFFNPVPVMKLVEIIQGKYTETDLIENLKDWFNKNGKETALCLDSPGFIVNRIARNYYGEPLRIVKTFNREKFREIDEIMKKVGGFRMGPFELVDLIGIDVNLSATKTIWEEFGKNPRFAPHEIQEERVAGQKLGKKTGEGYYVYDR